MQPLHHQYPLLARYLKSHVIPDLERERQLPSVQPFERGHNITQPEQLIIIDQLDKLISFASPYWVKEELITAFWPIGNFRQAFNGMYKYYGTLADLLEGRSYYPAG